jgi:methyltransferase (TIGR00027 family)
MGMAKKAAKTGIGPTALVAIEQYFPKKKRIINDDFAFYMLPQIAKNLMWLMNFSWIRNLMISTTEKNTPGLWSDMMCRKRYIDEKIINSVNIKEFVNIGGGFDTRAYRLKVLSKIPVYEIDQSENIEVKRTRIRNLFKSIPTNVNYVSTDFDKESLKDLLKIKGCNLEKKAFFILEAVTQYLTKKGIESTFDFLSQTASGSKLAFTYVQKDFIQGKNKYGWDKFYKNFVEKKVWIFGMKKDELPSFLKKYGWQLIEDVGVDELAKKYVVPTGRKLASTQIERIIYAKKL